MANKATKAANKAASKERKTGKAIVSCYKLKHLNPNNKRGSAWRGAKPA